MDRIPPDPRWMAPTHRAFAAYIAGTFALIAWAFFQGRLPDPLPRVAVHAVLLALVLLVARMGNRNRFWGLAQAWYPALAIPVLFGELHPLVPAFNPVDVDPLLIRADHALFGVHPTFAIEPWIWPPLVELLQGVYALFYFIPIALGVILWKLGRGRAFAEAQYAIVLGFLSSYLGYYLAPAIGPRFTQCPAPSGLWLATEIQNLLNHFEREMRDCFPSGHVEVSLLTLWCAWRLHPPTAKALTPIVAALIFSTVYLRYHYVVDLLAAVAWATAVALAVQAARAAGRFS